MLQRTDQLARSNRPGFGTAVAARGGFTVVEMLVTLAMIIVLVGILVVALSQASGTAQKAQTRFLMNSMSAGLAQFKGDHGYLPPVLGDGAAFGGGARPTTSRAGRGMRSSRPNGARTRHPAKSPTTRAGSRSPRPPSISSATATGAVTATASSPTTRTPSPTSSPGASSRRPSASGRPDSTVRGTRSSIPGAASKASSEASRPGTPVDS